MADVNFESRLDAIEKSLFDIKMFLEGQAKLSKRTFADSQLLNVEQCSQLTGLSISTIYKHCHNRRMPHFKSGKFLVFRKQEIESWLTNNRRLTSDEIENEANKFLTNSQTL